jgi:hypothetical protein
MLFLGILSVRITNSEQLMQESDTSRSNTCIDFMDDLSGPEEMNNTCVRHIFELLFLCLPWFLCPALSESMKTVTEL